MGYTSVTVGPRDLSGPSTRFYATAEVIAQYTGGNYSTIRLHAVAYNGPSGSTSSFYAGSGAMSSSIDAWGLSVVHSAGSNFLPSGYAQNQLRWDDWTDFNVSHDANGYLGPMTLRLGIAYNGYNESHYGTLYVDRIAQAPPAPAPVGLDQVTTTSMRYRFNSTGDGGSPITSWGVEYATNSSFTGATLIGSSGTSVVTGLNPGTTYYFRSRGQNAVGVGAWSSTSSATTLPSVPPGITVSPSLSGLSSTMTFSPPGGVSGVTEYNWEWRPVGGSTTAGSTTSNTKVVTGLTPGAQYEYRANAEIGTYTSPWSNWYLLTQPNPNTNPGNYFDGATAAGADVTYSWTGTAGNSTSIATGKGVTGWRTFAQGNSASGGAGVVTQATGGYAGSFSARVTFTTDATAAGFIGGVDVSGAATVQPDTVYYGSIHVRLPGRTQRLEGGIAWFTAANALISITWGTDVVVTASPTAWTRLTATATSPSNAAKAAPVVRDVTGTSWSLWLGGDVMWMDAAMVTMGQLIPYFDGDTADGSAFFHAWDGTPNASPSTRNQLPLIETDSLADPDCPPVPLPPVPPVIAADCITEVGTWRRYTVEIPALEIALWSSTLPTLILSTGSVAERQVRMRVYPNPDGLASEDVNTDTWDAELILTYIPPNTVMTLDSVTQRVRAEVNGAPPIVANQLLYGTNGVPATWPELRCGIGYIVTLDVPLDAPSGNLTTRVMLTSRV